MGNGVCAAGIGDIQGWLELAREVEHLFGPMAGEKPFRDALEEAVAKSCAFCIRGDVPGALRGAVAVSAENNEIAWLAVSRNERGKGLGALLLACALDRLDRSKDIRVQTFAENVTEGLAARTLYLRAGFRDLMPGGNNPAGIPTVIMKKQP